MDSEPVGAIGALMRELGKLPGIGPKTAERLTHYLLAASRSDVVALADALRAVKDEVRPCRQCCNLTEGDLCVLCSDPRRDASVLCVVEQPRDLYGPGEVSDVSRALPRPARPTGPAGRRRAGTVDHRHTSAARPRGRRAGSYHGHQSDAGR